MRGLETRYGSDENGLIWGFHLNTSGEAHTITADTAIEWLAGGEPPAEGSGFIWLHFSLANSHAIPWLKSHLALPEGYFETLRMNVGSTRLEQEANSLVAVIHDVLFDLTFDPNAVATSSVFINPRMFISARLRPLRAIEALRVALRDGARFNSPADLLAHLLMEQADVLLQILRDTSMRVDDIEDKLLASRIAFSRAELGSLRRMLVRLQRLLAPEPATFFRLLNRPPAWIKAKELQVLQQAAEEFSAAVGDTQALIERVKLLQEELAASVNEQTNRTLYVLTLVTVLALPINLVAGIFGMNVGGLPFTHSHYGFAVIVAMLIGLTLLLAYMALYKKRE